MALERDGNLETAMPGTCAPDPCLLVEGPLIVLPTPIEPRD